MPAQAYGCLAITNIPEGNELYIWCLPAIHRMIYMNPKRIQPDKWKHFFVGILLGAALHFLFTHLFSFSPGVAIIIALAAVIVISYGFELFSLVTRKGQYDVLDAVASVIGGVLGIAGIIILQSLPLR